MVRASGAVTRITTAHRTQENHMRHDCPRCKNKDSLHDRVAHGQDEQKCTACGYHRAATPPVVLEPEAPAEEPKHEA